jgi:hypothetical protein
MFKNCTLLIVFAIMVSCQARQSIVRTLNFPKIELKAEQLPRKENLWCFLMAGQSNMAGRGIVEPKDTLPSDRIFTINKSNELIIAKEPLHFYDPSMTGLDCGLSFGKAILKHLPDSISVLLIPTAIGGSSITKWLNDSIHRGVPLLTNFKEKVKIGNEYGVVKGVLWHQGEADANDKNIPLYKDRLSELFSLFRNVTGDGNLPILIGELGSYSRCDEDWQKINEQIRLCTLTDNMAFLINTFDLKDKGDKVHFNSHGQRTLGKRFAKTYLTQFLIVANKQ